ncbi:hypothetical protein GGP72_003052 [Salinibacter ruber]|uniref:Sulfotransferase domain-containing protein n=1 Tax=Salinibacter ruber TaxID=146919 RepID=A0A9X2Q1J1_9BACT|nr:sulfotransferase domain-containing protein [Salinibacter ruber]MCS3678774.1 hypothetical protein [Salinibacter ruber]MCS3682391.1 hypothetical protein [Salinibacter ruber]
MPEEIYPNDTFIVSYPKSGNTWVRFLLANALYPEAEVDFHSIHELIPEVGKEDMRRSGLPNPRLLKSHAPYQPDYPRVIYIVRDGRDVYTSYYHYRSPDLPEDTTFESFLKGSHWPTRWCGHVRDWMNAAAESDDILVVRFEDLKEDSGRELRRMLSFIDQKSISEAHIRPAVEASSFENMRRLEEERGRKYGDVDQFMRKGEAGGWQKLFTDRARHTFKAKEGEQLVQLGYEEDPDW